VPQDIEDDMMDHFNDPNFDLSSLRTSRSSFDFEMGNKRDEKAKSFTNESLNYTASEVDTESQVDATTHGAASTTHMQEIQYNE
jgi:hypothetical protein